MRAIFLVSSAIFAVFTATSIRADCNLNGVDDAEDALSGTSADCNQNEVPDECELVPIAFGFGEQTLPLPEEAREVVSGDFNGDGHTDIVAGYRDLRRNSTIAVFLNRGDRTFDAPLEFDAGSNLSGLAAGDVDGDDDLDLATANSTEILVFRNLGDGSFASGETYPVSRSTRLVRLADVSGDGVPELLATNGSNGQTAIFSNPGDGVFGAQQTVAAGGRPEALRTADLDNDGMVDLLLVDSSSSLVVVHLGQADGTFSQARTFPTGERPDGLEVGDFNGDGHIDAVTINLNDYSVLLNQGDGSLGPPELHEVLPRAIVSADLDHDGDLDLAVYTPVTADIRVLSGDGQGAFGVSGPGLSVPRGSLGLLSDDLDGDGDLEIVYFNDNSPFDLTILWNDVGINLQLERTPIDIVMRPHSGTLRDFDGDGVLDLVTANGNFNKNMSVLIGRGDGFFEPPINVEIPLSDLVLDGRRDLNFVTSGDFDGDGDFDVALADRVGEIVVFLNPGEADFADATFFPIDAAPFALDAADVNGDGSVDLVTANWLDNNTSVLLNDGNGVFGSHAEYATGIEPLSIKTVDVDGDGDIDIGTANRTSSDVSILFNQGDGSFPDRVDIPIPGAARSLVFGDFNRDGEVDFATANEPEESVSVVLGGGGGSFAAPFSILLGDPPYSIDVSDPTGDGFLDLITANERGSSVSFVVGNGDGSFQNAITFPAGISGDGGPRYTVSGDLDNDGDMDVVSLDRSAAELTYFLNMPTAAVVDTTDFLETICTEVEFRSVSLVSGVEDASVLATKYTLPAREDAGLLPALFQNVKRFALHPEFLARVFPERFPSLSTSEYNALVGVRETRDYFAGSIRRLRDGEEPRYEFTIITDTSDAAELLSQAEVADVYERLRLSFQLELLCYSPDTDAAAEEARNWVDPSFPVCFPENEPEPPPPVANPVFELEVPAATTVCGVFALGGAGRGPREEYELKSTIRLRGGVLELPTEADTFSAELFEEVVFGPRKEVAVAAEPGAFRVVRLPGAGGISTYRFTYQQEFSLADGSPLLLGLVSPLTFMAVGEEPVVGRRVLDDAFFTAEPGNEAIQGSLDGAPLLHYGSCSYSGLPALEVVAELEDGSTVRLQERFDPERSLTATSPAMVTRAELTLAGNQQVTTDYFRLVYAAFQHNSNLRYWVVLDSPMSLPDLDEPVYAVELFDERVNFDDPDAFLATGAAYLAENFDVIREVAVTSLRRGPGAAFRRGDVDSSGVVAVPDVILLLEYLFRRGGEPECQKAADADDNGRLNVADAIRILRAIFRDKAEPVVPPFPDCGQDPTTDALECSGVCL